MSGLKLYRTRFTRIIACVCLLAVIAATADKVVAGDEAKSPAPEAKSKWLLPPHFEKLDLSDDQKARVMRILEIYNPQVNNLITVIKNTGGRGSAVLTLSLSLTKLRNDRQRLCDEVLTKEQREKYRELQAASAAPSEEKPQPKKFKELKSNLATPKGDLATPKGDLATPKGESGTVLKGLTQAELEKSVKEHSEWQPIAVKGYAKGTESRFDITWQPLKGAGRWYVYTDMSAEGFARRKEELKGFKVEVQSSWEVDGQERFAAIWREK